ALALQQLGLQTALIERAAEFRDRIRGETIHPWGASEIRALGLEAVAERDAGALRTPHWQTYRDRIARDPHTWAEHFPDRPHGLSVRHHHLQNAVFAAAGAAGATIFRPSEATLGRVGPSLEITVSGPAATSVLRPRMLVGADGQRSAVRRWIGGSASRDPIHHAIGGALIRGLEIETDRVHQAFFEGGFVLISPQRDHVSRVYLVCASEEAESIQRDPEPATRVMARVAESLPEGTVGAWESIGPVGFFPNANIVVERPDMTDVVLIGDAAGANDPCQGHGVSLTFHDVRVLRDLFESGMDWAGIPAAFNTERDRYFDVLRQHARWSERVATETGPEIDMIRDQISRARELDPTAGGFAAIFATGPDRLVADDAARRHFLGEDLPVAPLIS
ncbi:MAG TPA: NAD(P)/FAD-dependent oxidoreductase, partial [Thermomicrobiales bacterium]|nr:NAD(P)/FAD-dependent oxidoreductase [Thermomicrobiales bacterium]